MAGIHADSWYWGTNSLLFPMLFHRCPKDCSQLRCWLAMILIAATVVPFQTFNGCNHSAVVAEARLLTTVMRTGFATVFC